MASFHIHYYSFTVHNFTYLQRKKKEKNKKERKEQVSIKTIIILFYLQKILLRVKVRSKYFKIV